MTWEDIDVFINFPDLFLDDLQRSENPYTQLHILYNSYKHILESNEQPEARAILLGLERAYFNYVLMFENGI